MLTGSHSSSFQGALAKFKSSLTKQQQKDFQGTSLDQLKEFIVKLQQQQHGLRRIENLAKLGPFLEAMEQYGKVIDVFCNSNEFVPFIWGPLKFVLTILQSAHSVSKDIMDAYKAIGDEIPFLLQYESLFQHKPHMGTLLVNIYQDVIRFHEVALEYLQKNAYRQLFEIAWPPRKAKISQIVSDIGTIAVKITRQVTLAQIEDLQAERRLAADRFETMLGHEKDERRQKVAQWLRAPDTDSLHDKIFEARKDYPETGQWLLNNPSFGQEWFDWKFARAPPLLWINGMPGSGKTILASLIIEEARKIRSQPTVLFFYFKHQKPEYDNFDSLARGLLMQMLKQDSDTLLDLIYHERCKSDELFASAVKVRHLLRQAFAHSKGAYIILDGLDECKRDERKFIAKYFRELVGDLPVSDPLRIRCLFISRHDGDGRRDFEDIDSLEIKPSDVQNDIELYCRRRANLLPSAFEFSDDRKQDIAKQVAHRADGMFLLARLLWQILMEQQTRDAFNKELESAELPRTLNEAYRRIISNFKKDTAGRDLARIPNDIHRLLQWLVLSKRSLKWREIQVLKSISTTGDDLEVDLQQKSYLVHVKQICGPLVNFTNGEDDDENDGTVDLIHLTCRQFLVDEGIVDTLSHDISMTLLCLDYLNSPMFVSEVSKETALRGDYGLMEYAVKNWVKHLEGVLAETYRRVKRGKDIRRDPNMDFEENDRVVSYPVLHEHEIQNLLNILTEALGVYTDHYWKSPTRPLDVSQRNLEKLRVFQGQEFYERLQQIYVSTRKQLHSYNPIKKELVASTIADTVQNVRVEIEGAFADASHKASMVRYYGKSVYKCPRLVCDYFTSGFNTLHERDQHINTHDLPFRCKDPDCTRSDIGFDTQAKLNRHTKKNHPDQSKQDTEYPTDKDYTESAQAIDIESQKRTEAETQVPVMQPTDPSIETEVVFENEDTTPPTQEASSSDDDLETEIPNEPEIRPAPEPQSQPLTDLKCPVCGRTFSRKYNLNSHMKSHSTERPLACDSCPKRFSRKSDLKRHMKGHSGEKNHVCGGCQSRFIRAHELKSHQKTARGQMCLFRARQTDSQHHLFIPD